METMIRTNFPQPHEQRKIEKLLARLAQIKRDQTKPAPKAQGLKKVSAA
jgi:hypothetical protein